MAELVYAADSKPVPLGPPFESEWSYNQPWQKVNTYNKETNSNCKKVYKNIAIVTMWGFESLC